MRKKFLSLILAMCMVMSLLPMTAFAVGGTPSTTPSVAEKDNTVALATANATSVIFTLNTKDAGENEIEYAETATVKVYPAATGEDVVAAVTGAIGTDNKLTLSYDSTKDTEKAGFAGTYYITIDEDATGTDKEESDRVALTVGAYVAPTATVALGSISTGGLPFDSTEVPVSVTINPGTATLTGNVVVEATATSGNTDVKLKNNGTVAYKSGATDVTLDAQENGKLGAAGDWTLTITKVTVNDAEISLATSQKTLTVKVAEKAKTALKADLFNFTKPTNLTYDGKAKEATVTLKDNTNAAKVGDFTVEYYKGATKVDAAIDAGEYTVKINAKGGTDYAANPAFTDVSWTFTIAKAELTPTVALTGTISNEYNGDENLSATDLAKLTVTFKDGDNNTVALNSSDYTVTAAYADADAGANKPITVTIALKEDTDAKTNYTLAAGGLVTGSDLKGTITKKELTSSVARYLKNTNATEAIVDLSTIPGLPDGVTFTYAAADNQTPTGFTAKVETNTLTLTAKGGGTGSETYVVNGDSTNYTVTITVTVTYTDKEVTSITGLTKADATYDGTAKNGYSGTAAAAGVTDPTFTYTYAKADGTALTEAPEDAGDYTVTVTLNTNDDRVADPVVFEFTISPANISSAVVTLDPEATYTYTGQPIIPTITSVKASDAPSAATLEKDTDYTIENTSNTNAGSATVTLKGTGNYTGDKAVTFTIAKANVTPPASSASVAVGSSTDIVVNTDGAITATSSNNDTVTATAGTGKVTITGVAAGTATVTISAVATTNYNELADTTVTVTVTSGGGGGGGTTTPTEPTDPVDPNPPSTGEDVSQTVKPDVSEGTASATVDKETADKLVSDAVDNKSENVTVKVDVPADADVNEVKADIPASSVADLASKTDAALTVDTPVANVTIPNETLSQLGGASGNVTVTAAVNEDNSVKVEVQANGSTVGSLNGGMKVDLPVNQPTAGTVAVLVDENGNETILPKSSLDGSEMAVLLETGSATIKFVDNAQSFADTDSHWAKNSIAFVSSRNLFQGMENNNFKADVPMNRAMLVTVLHRLESTPDAAGSSFDDVPSDSYYATAAAWAAGKGIVTGDASGFSGDRSVTREEMAVMLYRYVQTINGNKGTLGSFSGMGGASDVSSWANQAMRWAVGSGIISGDNSGNLNPGSTATRGEVSQMLMNFVKLITK